MPVTGSTGSGTLTSNQSVSDFGTFDYTLGNLASGDISSVSFTVNSSGGFTSASQLLTDTSDGADFCAHLVDSSSNVVGYAAAVSENWGLSDSLGLFGLALVAFGVLTRLGVLRTVHP